MTPDRARHAAWLSRVIDAKGRATFPPGDPGHGLDREQAEQALRQAVDDLNASRPLTMTEQDDGTLVVWAAASSN